MQLKSLPKSYLAIGSYPYFQYDASNGGGEADSNQDQGGNLIHLRFSSSDFSVPSLNWRTAKISGIPIPPGIEIKINPTRLEGVLNKSTGEISLVFESLFTLSILSIFHFSPLTIKTSLVTSEAKSQLFKVEGETLKEDGKATLVGIAKVPLSGNRLLDKFLGLPTEALAILKCKLS